MSANIVHWTALISEGIVASKVLYKVSHDLSLLKSTAVTTGLPGRRDTSECSLTVPLEKTLVISPSTSRLSQPHNKQYTHAVRAFLSLYTWHIELCGICNMKSREHYTNMWAMSCAKHIQHMPHPTLAADRREKKIMPAAMHSAHYNQLCQKWWTCWKLLICVQYLTVSCCCRVTLAFIELASIHSS